MQHSPEKWVLCHRGATTTDRSSAGAWGAGPREATVGAEIMGHIKRDTILVAGTSPPARTLSTRSLMPGHLLTPRRAVNCVQVHDPSLDEWVAGRPGYPLGRGARRLHPLWQAPLSHPHVSLLHTLNRLMASNHHLQAYSTPKGLGVCWQCGF